MAAEANEAVCVAAALALAGGAAVAKYEALFGETRFESGGRWGGIVCSGRVEYILNWN
eukprot:SAG11_NODE_263_length_11526_cov_23.830314_7_plen_58_part_00